MRLSVPQRHAADASSFPTDPESVAQWLDSLEPLKTRADTRELLRGLRHSNRLANSVSRRRAVLARFYPTLRAVENRLTEECQAQCLPLTEDFRRSLQLLDSLLREENLALKILLDESSQPEADDLRRAMQSLVKQAELMILSYRPLPGSLLAEADLIFRLAETRGLLEHASDPVLPSTARLYAYIKLLSLADMHAERTRQLGLLLALLKHHASEVAIQIYTGGAVDAQTLLVWQPEQGTRPVPPDSLLPSAAPPLLYQLDLHSLLLRLQEQSGRAHTATSFLLGADILERQTLERVQSALCRDRIRRAPRAIRRHRMQLVFSHRAICASLCYGGGESADRDTDALWSLIDENRYGAALETCESRAGVVQVGELVALDPLASADQDLSIGALHIAVVRRVVSRDHGWLQIGIEYLCRNPMVVSLSRPSRADTVPDSALFTNHQNDDDTPLTLLVADFRYRSGDRLLLHDRHGSQEVELAERLSSNGLFSQYRLCGEERAYVE